MKGGTKVLSKEGASEWAKIKARHATRLANLGDDPIVAMSKVKKIRQEAVDELESVLADNPNWLDKGGVKLFGQAAGPNSAAARPLTPINE